MDAVADSKDMIMQMLHDLHQQYQNRQWLLVNMYEILQALEFEYGEELRVGTSISTY